MDLTNYSLDEFLCQTGEPQPVGIPPMDIVVPKGSRLNYPVLKSYDQYSIVLVDDGGDVAAVDVSGNEAGYYVGNSLVVHSGHQRKGLATAMVLFAYKYRKKLPKNRKLSEAGKKALTAAWEVANGKRTSDWWP